MKVPNKPDALNPAMARQFTIVGQWHRVSNLERWTAPEHVSYA
jgi:hypothetical protein